MLFHLAIKDIALIEHLEIDFAPGLNVLTGETGAGKSIIIDAVNLAIGGRAERELIRSGQTKASVDAAFEVDERHIADLMEESGIELEDSTVILSRQIAMNGRNLCRINGQMVPLSLLRAVGERLLDIHGQHEHQYLMDAGRHIGFLDAQGDDAFRVQLAKVAERYASWRAAVQKLKRLRENQAERARRLDILSFQISEIEEAALSPGEEEELSRQRVLLQNSGRISSALNEAYDLIYASSDMPALTAVQEAIDALDTISAMDDAFEAIKTRISEVYYQLEDISLELRPMRESMELDPRELDGVEERLELIRKLERKYGKNIEEVLAFLADAREQYEGLIHLDEDLETLGVECDRREKELYAASFELSKAREKLARRLEKAVLKQLQELDMGKSRFEVRDRRPSGPEEASAAYTASGFDEIEFFISTNPGEPLKPIAKVASVGELSRLMLAIKTVAAEVDEVETLIFDEVDTGISGTTGQKVALKMSEIAAYRQVISVTHLPQIAAMADEHLSVQKISDDVKSSVCVASLDEDGKIREVARLAGGLLNEAGLRHGRELILNAKELKAQKT